MRIIVVVLLACFLPGCANLAMSLVYSGIETGIGALESAAVTKTKKIGEDQLAQLKPGMTREEVRELLQKPPMMITTKEDGGSTATYIYNTDSQNRDRSMMGIIGIMGAFTKTERESQTVMIQFNSKGRYVTHTIMETRVCGSQATGYYADNCEDQKTAGVN